MYFQSYNTDYHSPGGFVECSRRTWWGGTLTLWAKRLYTTVFDTTLERDVQYVFISSMSLNTANDTLTIRLARGLVYALHLSNLTSICPRAPSTYFRRMPVCNSDSTVIGMSRTAWARYWAPGWWHWR
eukprot:6145189-Prymnesium_polylepis.1